MLDMIPVDPHNIDLRLQITLQTREQQLIAVAKTFHFHFFQLHHIDDHEPKNSSSYSDISDHYNCYAIEIRKDYTNPAQSNDIYIQASMIGP